MIGRYTVFPVRPSRPLSPTPLSTHGCSRVDSQARKLYLWCPFFQSTSAPHSWLGLFPHWWRHRGSLLQVPASPRQTTLLVRGTARGFPNTSHHNKLSSGCTLGFLVIYWTIHLFPWDFGLSFTRPPQTHYRSGGWTSLPLLEFAGNKKAPSKPAWAACLVSTRGCHVVHVAPKRPKTFCSLPA